MNESDAIHKLKRQLSRIEGIRGEHASSPAFQKWYRDTKVAIERIFGSDSSQILDFVNNPYYSTVVVAGMEGPSDEEEFANGLENATHILTSMIEEIEDYGLGQSVSQVRVEPLDNIRRLCDRFHRVASKLKSRHAGRQTLIVGDEYDAQDLFHALLRIYFSDIRPEEWTPSYGGGASRMDLLLKSESIVVELKKTRENLRDRQVADELIIDIQRYRSHPDCRALVCFVYDPDERLSNPAGLETDLSSNDPFPVYVIVRPFKD